MEHVYVYGTIRICRIHMYPSVWNWRIPVVHCRGEKINKYGKRRELGVEGAVQQGQFWSSSGHSLKIQRVSSSFAFEDFLFVFFLLI